MKFSKPEFIPSCLENMVNNFGDELTVVPVLELVEKGLIFVEDGNHGNNRPRKNEFVEYGIPFIRPPDLKDGRVDFSGIDCINEDGFNRVRKGIGKAGDIILTHRATVGRIAITDESDPSVFVTNPGTTVWRSLDNSVLDQQYLYCYMRSPEFMSQLWANVGNNCTFDYVSLTQQRALLVAFPSIEKQRVIAGAIRSIDKKIDGNRQINQTLEQIAQGIFKSWFVDFEPVKAKIQAKQNGQDPERAAMRAISGKTDEQIDQLSPEQHQQLTTIAALFPDELEDSELGEIPKGWSVSDLKTVTTELRRGISPKYTEENGIQVVNQKCIRNHSINFELTRLNDPLKRKVDGRQIEVGDVLVNSTGVGTLGRLAPVRYLPEPSVFDSHVTVVRADTEVISKSFLASLMIVKESFIEASGAGSTGQTELRKEVLQDIKFVKPPMKLGIRFDAIVGPMNKQIAELEQQQQVLAQLRDSLLPKLLSGEIVLGDTQSTEEAVA